MEGGGFILFYLQTLKERNFFPTFTAQDFIRLTITLDYIRNALNVFLLVLAILYNAVANTTHHYKTPLYRTYVRSYFRRTSRKGTGIPTIKCGLKQLTPILERRKKKKD